MNIEELTTEIDRLTRIRDELQFADRKRKSRAVIEALEITKEDVTRHDDPGMPFHGIAYSFGEWLEKNDIRTRYCQWNSRIYSTAALRKGVMVDIGCDYEDIAK